MKKVLIATTNKRKYDIEVYLLRKAGMDEENYIFYSLADINYNGPDKKENGNNIERAKTKALNVIDNIDRDKFDYVLGIDDGMIVKGEKTENIKEYLKKILYENYLTEGESIVFSRAYFMIDKNGRTSTTEAKVPFTYKPANDAIMQGHPYPLEQVSLPLGKTRTLSQLSAREYNDYYWAHSCAKIRELLKPFEIQVKRLPDVEI